MIFITGGACQGKLTFGKSLSNTELYADGVCDCVEAAFERPLIYGFHLYIRRLLEEGKDAEAFTEQLIKNNPNAIVITNELGCGIVPMDPKDRNYRDAAGKMGQKLAAYSDEVYRVICGISTRIK